jgi:hypothetical protein
MNETESDFEKRSRELFKESVARIDARTRSRLTQARHAAVEASAASHPASWRWARYTPAVGFAAALVLGVAIWMNHPQLSSGEGASPIEVIDMVASNEEFDLIDEDIDFYNWADEDTDPSASVG